MIGFAHDSKRCNIRGEKLGKEISLAEKRLKSI